MEHISPVQDEGRLFTYPPSCPLLEPGLSFPLEIFITFHYCFFFLFFTRHLFVLKDAHHVGHCLKRTWKMELDPVG